MVIYSSDALLSPNISSSIEKPFSEDTSIFEYALSLIEKSDNDIRQTLKEAHIKSISEGVMITESFNIIDIIRDIILAFIDTIKNLFNRFKAFITKVFYSKSSLENNKERILKFDGSLEVEFDRYIYTCTDPRIPCCDMADHFDKEFEDLKDRIKVIAPAETKNERMNLMDQVHRDLKAFIADDYYDKVRQSVIRTSYPIDSSICTQELFNVYRNGGAFTSSRVTHSEVEAIVERYFNAKSTIKKVEAEKREICNSANRVIDLIKRVNLKDVSSSYRPYSVEEENLFDSIRSLKAGQVSEVANIYAMAFAAKLDALKESMIQDKKVLFEVLYWLEDNDK